MPREIHAPMTFIYHKVVRLESLIWHDPLVPYDLQQLPCEVCSRPLGHEPWAMGRGSVNRRLGDGLRLCWQCAEEAEASVASTLPEES
jgi:hypothetical protein